MVSADDGGNQSRGQSWLPLPRCEPLHASSWERGCIQPEPWAMSCNLPKPRLSYFQACPRHVLMSDTD